jgi:hypothetical protein
MSRKEESRVLMDLETLNTVSEEGCAVCGGQFTLGEIAVLARGRWEGRKFVHENEAFFDKRANEYYERVPH